MFKDKLGNSFTVTLASHGDGLAVTIAHPAYNGGQPIAVTGCRAEAGAFATMQAWAQQFESGNLPDELCDLNGKAYPRA